MKILSLDFGTSSLKLAVLDEQMKMHASASRPYQYRVYDADKVEMDPDLLLGALKSGMRALDQYAGEIELVAFCTFSPSGVYLDRSNQLLYPVITHLDRRAKQQSRQIIDVFGAQEFQTITGILPFVGGASVTTLKWMLENKKDVMRNVKTYAHLPTWLYARMTGVLATDPVNASMTGLYETVTSAGWSEEILTALEIDASLLPEIHPAGSILGTLGEEMAALCGLRCGIPVALGTNDIASALVGADCIKSGMALNVCGSSEMISVLTHIPAVHPRYYLRKSAIEGLWQCYSTMVGGFGLDWFFRQLCREMDEETFFQSYLPSCMRRCDCESTVFCEPYLAGDRQSLNLKRGAFCGLTLESTREEMLISLLKGMNLHMLDTLEAIPQGVPIYNEISITGGMVRPEIIDMKQTMFGGKRFLPKENCTLIGNARLAISQGIRA
ncbi:MAG TPA: FGGY family carbohydrate kinase [Clostridia bacterium]|nr:FGGY family carbohydrate kinase [Clostridia bacterium]